MLTAASITLYGASAVMAFILGVSIGHDGKPRTFVEMTAFAFMIVFSAMLFVAAALIGGEA